jgi:hypothetical protein
LPKKAKILCLLFCSARHYFYGFYVTFFVANAQNNTLQLARSSQLQTVVANAQNKKSAIKTIPSYVT